MELLIDVTIALANVCHSFTLTSHVTCKTHITIQLFCTKSILIVHSLLHINTVDSLTQSGKMPVMPSRSQSMSLHTSTVNMANMDEVLNILQACHQKGKFNYGEEFSINKALVV